MYRHWWARHDLCPFRRPGNPLHDSLKASYAVENEALLEDYDLADKVGEDVLFFLRFI
jgi:hypothetical protein